MTFVFAIVLWSCHDKLELVAPTSGTDGQAFIKFAQVSPSFRQVLNNRDSFNIYVNGAKLNGSFLTYGSIFPSTSNLYAAVPAGTIAIRITVNGVATPDSITLATFTKTMTAGSYYSFMISDSLLNSADAKQIFVEDKFAITDTTHYTVRFAHTILNDTLGKNVDVYSMRLAANMFSNISPGTITPFASEPYSLLADTIIVRRAGTNFELTRYATNNATNGILFARQRAYTLLYKGTSGTTGTKPRTLSNIVNQ